MNYINKTIINNYSTLPLVEAVAWVWRVLDDGLEIAVPSATRTKWFGLEDRPDISVEITLHIDADPHYVFTLRDIED